MDAKALMRQSAVKALTAPGSVLTGGVAVAASFALLNPLPAILWALGAGSWTVITLSNGRYAQTVIEEDRAARAERAVEARDALRKRIAQVLAASPFAPWIASGDLPDYLKGYDHLLDIRRRVAQITRDRSGIAAASDDQITEQLDRMLAAFLKFVWSRIAYLQILTGERVAPGVLSGGASPAPPPRASRYRKFLAFFQYYEEFEERGEQRVEEEWSSDRRRRSRARGSLLDTNAARETIAEKIRVLTERMECEPAAREVLASNVKLLERQRTILEDCAARDARVSAQLDAFSDAFELILSQVGATQFDAAGVVEYMGSLATQVAETEQFVAAMQPLTDDFFSDVALATSESVAS